MKLAMMADAAGLDYSAKVIMENKITGTQVLSLTDEDLIDLGIYSRRERKSLLKWVESKVKESHQSKDSKKYQQMGTGAFGALNLQINPKQPRNLGFWEKDGNEAEDACIKCYFDSDIQIFTAPKGISIEDLTNKIKLIFGFSIFLPLYNK